MEIKLLNIRSLITSEEWNSIHILPKRYLQLSLRRISSSFLKYYLISHFFKFVNSCVTTKSWWVVGEVGEIGKGWGCVGERRDCNRGRVDNMKKRVGVSSLGWEGNNRTKRDDNFERNLKEVYFRIITLLNFSNTLMENRLPRKRNL